LSCEGTLPIYFCGVGFVSYLSKTFHCFVFDSLGFADSWDVVAGYLSSRNTKGIPVRGFRISVFS
jgi:hypothetical protein